MKLATWTLVIIGLAMAAAAARPPDVPVDAWGRPVLDPWGHRLEYAGPGAALLPEAATATWSPPADDARPKLFDPLAMRDDATIGNFTQDLGTKGIHAVDTDGDGLPEIVVAHGAMWYLLEYEPRLSGWTQRYFLEYAQGSTFGGGTILDVRVGDTDGDGGPEVVVLVAPGTFEIRDAATGVLEATLPIAVDTHADFEVEDVDGAPPDEIVELDADGLRVFAVGSATPLWSVPGLPGTDVAIGNVDLDAAKEIVLGSGSSSQVVDCGTRLTEWAYSTGFGHYVDVADVDGDGIEEIAGCFDWGSCQLVDGDTRVEKWGFDNFDTSAVRCRDVNGDGLAEVGLGDGQWGDVHFRDGLTGGLVGRVANPEHSVAFIDFADVDGDCESEVLWGAGYSSTGNDHLFVGTLRTQAFEWRNLEYDGPMHAFAIADVDADGRFEVVRACSESDAGYDGAYVFVTDLHARRDEWVPTTQTNDGWMVTRGMGVLQADADAPLEYVMNSSTTYSGTVGAYDGVTHQRQWVSAIFDGEYINSIAVGDPDDDGDADVLVGTGREHTGAAGVFLRVLQGTDGAILYRSPSFSSGFGAAVDQIRVADVDDDGASEILFLNQGVGVRVYHGTTHAEEWFLPDTTVTALDVADLVPGGALEIVLGRDDGRVLGYDGASHAPLFNSPVAPERITAVRLADVDGDGTLEIVIGQMLPTTGSTSVVKVLAPEDRSVKWTSPPLVGTAGAASCLFVADVDDDGQKEIAVSGSYTLRFFEHDDGVADAVAPAFAGVTDATGIIAATCCPTVDVSWDPGLDLRSPPLRYEVHRSETAGFSPSAATLLASTERTSYRDQAVAPATTYHYLVRSFDSRGNEEANLVRASFTTGTDAPPVAPANLAVTDPVACDLSGVDVSFTPATPPPGLAYDLLVDGITEATDISSPWRHVPGDAAVHTYRVLARSVSCGTSVTTGAELAADAGQPLDAPILTSVTDLDACQADGLRIAFTPSSFTGAGHHEILMDGGVVLSPATSPAVVTAPDALPHAWSVRAVDETCVRSRDSSPTSAADAERVAVAPTAVAVTDTDPCAPSLLTLAFTHPGFPTTGHFELWRDGSLYFSPVTAGQLFPPFDEQPHDYFVVAVDEECGVSAGSAPVRAADEVNCGAPALEVELRVARATALADGVVVRWTPATGAVGRHDVYVGTLASLGGAVYDHVASRSGLSFPDAPDTSSGCGATDGATLTTRIDGLGPAAYLLVIAVGTDGVPGPFGRRSDGLDRHDPSVDPRPPSAFCP